MPRDMLAPDPNQPLPRWPGDLHAMYRELQVRHIPDQPHAATQVVQAIRTLYTNGGAEFASFEIEYHPTLHYYVSRGRLEGADFFRRFLKLPAVTTALPKVTEGAIKPLDFASHSLQWGSSLTLDGEVAQLLVNGGAYTRYPATPPPEAKALGGRFCEALFGNRYTEVEIYRAHCAWSGWFFDVAWDATWFGIDKRLRRVWILCATDTD